MAWKFHLESLPGVWCRRVWLHDTVDSWDCQDARRLKSGVHPHQEAAPGP